MRLRATTKGLRLAVSYFIRYTGTPADRDAFLAHYRDKHAQILREYLVSAPAASTTPSRGTIPCP